MLRSPLEQFQIIPLITLESGKMDFTITNSSLVFLFLCFTTYAIAKLIYFEALPSLLSFHYFESAIEKGYDFVLNLTKENLGPHLKYFNFILTLFTFIAFSNLFGFIPYVFCTTSHVIVTLALSVSI